MALNFILSHIPNDRSNHGVLLQEDEICFYPGKAGDTGPREDNPALALLQFEISALDWMNYMPLGGKYEFKIVFPIVLLQVALSSGLECLCCQFEALKSPHTKTQADCHNYFLGRSRGQEPPLLCRSCLL